MRNVGKVRALWRYPVKGMAGESIASSPLGANGLTGDRHWALRDETRSEVQSCKTRPQLLQCQARYREPPREGAVAPIDVVFPDGTIVAGEAAGIHGRLSELVGRPSTLQALRPASDVAFFRRHKTDDHTWLAELAATFDREAGEPLPAFDQLPPILVDCVSVPGTFFLVTPLHVVTTASLAALKQMNPAADWDERRFRANVVIETAPGLEGLVEQAWIGGKLRIGSADIACVGATPRCGAISRAQRDFGFDAGLLRTVVNRADQNVGVYGMVEQAGEVRVGDPVMLADA